MSKVIKDTIVEDFNKYNEDPNKTVEEWVEDMNALYAQYHNVYKDIA